jgi:hypothetical protein
VTKSSLAVPLEGIAMDFGIAMGSNADARKTVKRAEELDFTHAWFYDSQLLLLDIVRIHGARGGTHFEA